MESYCDIIPHATGWVYVIDDVQSLSFYHTYEHALQAARMEMASHFFRKKTVFRTMAVNGRMIPLETGAHSRWAL